MRIGVIGGGIGGLTAAIALRAAGHDVRVFERASAPGEVGAGIGLWGNAVTALRRIGLADRVLARGERMLQADFLTAAGEMLTSSTVDEFEKWGTEGIVLVHRAELLEELLGALPANVLRFGCELERYEEGGTAGTFSGPGGPPVRAIFRNGETAEADLLIGADGLHSAVRRQLIGDGPPRYSGYTCWRAVTPFPESRVPPGYVGEVWGRGARFGITRIGKGRVYWWATLNAPASPMEQGQLDDSAKATLLRSHGAFCEPVPALIEATDAGRIIRNDIYDRRPWRGWSSSRGRVLLIGDAAHPTTPNLGQGGCMAIEDGVVLGEALLGVSGEDGPALAARLRAFERFRFAKTRSVVNQSLMFGWIGQRESPLFCWGRDLLTALVAKRGMRASVRKIGVFDEWPGRA